MTKVLVTGGAGSLGTCLLKLLNKSHDMDVTVLDNLSTGRRLNVPQNIELVPLDVLDARVDNIFDEEKFDVVIHLASQNCQEEAEEDPVDDAAVNILGALHILDNAKRIGAKKVIMASSKADEGQESFNEVSKLAAENYCKLYEKLYGMGCTVLRFAKKREEEACARAILACIS